MFKLSVGHISSIYSTTFCDPKWEYMISISRATIIFENYLIRQYLVRMIFRVFQTLQKWTSCFVQVQNLFEERRKKWQRSSVKLHFQTDCEVQILRKNNNWRVPVMSEKGRRETQLQKTIWWFSMFAFRWCWWRSGRRMYSKEAAPPADWKSVNQSCKI